METQPDLSFYFAIHRAQRAALVRYRAAVAALPEDHRQVRGQALARWAKGMAYQLEEHHDVEDRFFFPSLRSKVPSVEPVLDELEDDHRRLDQVLARWASVGGRLADPATSFEAARADAIGLAEELHDLLHHHLDVEDSDVLPLFWRHYSASEYQAVEQTAIKKGKKKGLWFIAPFTVDCFTEGAERDAFLAGVPAVLRVLHRLLRPRYERLTAVAFAEVGARSLG